ncbi:MFS transporter [Sphingomonas sp. 2SG]|uniref:MFS transporter n=1 Tax=Sphingomonas sp. 2SG TaxID=2502201 RepID=UPI0010F82B52|nr:MFS transporter [Sphingomonas sp. 2SG]
MTKNRWIVLVALAYMLSIGMALPIYAGSVINTSMVVDMSWNRQTLGLLVGANMIVNGLLAPGGAFVVQKIGVRHALIAGATLMALVSAALATIVTAPWQAILAFGLGLGIAGNLTGIIACQTGVAQWFDEQRTTALSLLYAAMGVGGFASVWIVTRAIEASHDWRAGWWIFAAAAAAGAIVATLVIRNRLDASGTMAGPGMPIAPDSGAARSVDETLTLGGALRSPFLWAVCLCMLASTSAAAFVVAHVQAYLRDVGFSPTGAASAVSLFSLATLGGNLAVGPIAAKSSPRIAYAAALGTLAIAMLILINVHGSPMLYAFAIIAGIGFGASQVGSMAILGHYWSTRLFPALTALGLLIQTAGGGAVPIIAGAYFDANHNYTAILVAIVLLNVIGAAVLMVARPPVHAPVAAVA